MVRSDHASARRAALVGLLACLWVALAWGWVLRTGLWGWDVYPLIAAGRVDGLGGVAATFGDELMGGRYPLGRYWRPLVHLSFGLDHALFGLDPLGYHLTDLALLAANVLAVATLARRWISERAALVGAVVFGGNLVHADVLAVPARRADSLALLFTLLALTSVFARRRFLAALAVAAALASKESGAIAVLVASGAAFALAQGERRERWRQALRAAWPAWCAFALTLGVRTWALGGLGGSREAQVSAAWSDALASLARYFPAAFAPTQARLLGGGAFSCAVALAAVALYVVLARRDARRTLVPLLLWFVALASLTAISRAERGWYELPFVALNGLFAAALFERAFARVGIQRALALPMLAWALASLFPWRAASPELIAAGESARVYLGQVESAVRNASAGSAVRAPGLPQELRDPRPWLDGRERTFAVLAPYSVAAFVELAFPGRAVRVVPPAPPSLPDSSQIVLVLER
ncbi:MAG: hypothetical protein FJ298_15405 [Planctomycetes bacterium]|nr:hypothetical protein [Planctomycetota bacterium]